MRRNMLRKPLLREGVRDWARPRLVIQSGARRATVAGGLPDRPSTRRAARPLVRAESESAVQCRVPSARNSGTTHTWDTQPRTLWASVWSAAGRGANFLPYASSWAYLILGSGT